VRLPDALAWLDTHHNRELVPGGLTAAPGELTVDTMAALCTLIGDPQHACPVIHVTGTNGKGSVTAMVSSLLAANGLTVGTYTSPHLTRVNERMARNGEPISDEELAEVLSEVAALEPLVDATASWFELVTAAALSWFATSAVDVAVIEVGMLGRHDATNVVDADVAVVTSIGFDHTDGQGDWELAIAQEKAGIVGSDCTLVLGPVPDRLQPVFAAEGPARLWVAGTDFGAVAQRRGVGGQMTDLYTPHGTYDDVFVAAYGAHQCTNAAIAVAAVEALFDRPLEPAVVSEALGSLALPGRFQVVSHNPLVVVDGAHNPPAADSVAATLADEFHTDGRRVLVWAMLADRDPAAFLDALGPAGIDAVVACTAPTPRARPASALAAVAATRGLPVEVVDDPVDAVRRAVDAAGESDVVLVTGSMYLVGPVVESLTGERTT
jgi:dihydrofolate synthase/folylpolyglutamate synthase